MSCNRLLKASYPCVRGVLLSSRTFGSSTVCLSQVQTTSSPLEDLTVMRARLLYQSKKRGILENDILLGDFADQYLSKMERDVLQQYDKMINGDHMEWDLYYYLSGKKEAPSELTSLQAFKLIKEFVDEKKQRK